MGTLVLDQDRFCGFMRRAWGLDVEPFDLNLLEYYGLVIPLRKAIVEGLCLPPREDQRSDGVECHHPFQRWAHVPRAWTSLRSRSRVDRAPVMVNLERRFPELPHHFRPMPVLECGYESVLCDVITSGDSGRGGRMLRPRQRLAPLMPPIIYTPNDLWERRRWLRPFDPAYWACLARSGFTQQPESSKKPADKESWIAARSGGVTDALTLTPERAEYGNQGVTRFYVVGSGGGPSGTLGQGVRRIESFGQDWWVASLLSRLRFRSGTGLALRVEAALQREKTNTKAAVLLELRKRWAEMQALKDLSLPTVHTQFYRNALLWLLHRSRPQNISQREALCALGEAVDMAPASVRAALYSGQQWLLAS